MSDGIIETLVAYFTREAVVQLYKIYKRANHVAS